MVRQYQRNMATIVLKWEGKRGKFFNDRRCFLMVRGEQHDKDGDVLLHPVDYRSVTELEATVERSRYAASGTGLLRLRTSHAGS